MAIKTWIGAAGGAWSTTTNWSPSGVPASTDDIVFTGDASPTISSTARTCANLTVNGGTVSIGGTAAFTITGTITNNGSFTLPAAPTIQGSIVNNGYMESTTSATITVSGGNFQTWALGSHNFHNLTLNKTTGTELRLDSALNLLRSTNSAFSYTAGNLNQNGNSISCRSFTESGSTARTWNMNAVVDITPIGTSPLSINDTTITFSNKNTFTITPQSGTGNITVTGMGGAATTALCATAVRSNNPSIALYTNLNDGSYRNWQLAGFWEAVTINGNFAFSYFGYWTDINGTYTTALQGSATTGSEVSVFALLTSNNTTTWNYPARVYRITTAAGGVAAGTVLTDAQFTSYAWNWWDGGPIGRAVVYDLGCQYATHNILIDGNWNTWVTYTLNCTGANSTYNLEYASDNGTSTAFNLSGTNSTYNLKDVNILGTITHTLGTVQLSSGWQPVRTRVWSTSGGNRHINFADQYIVVNGNHRSGTNGTGSISTGSQTASTTLTTDSPIAGGGFLCQTSSTISIGTTWAVTSLPHITIESLANAALLQTSSAIYARTLTVNNAVSLGSSSVPITVYITHNITWNGNSPAAHTLFRYCNLNYYGQNENTTIDCRPYNDPTNVNYRFNSIVTSNTAGTSTVNWNIYALTFSWTRPGGTCTIQDVYLTSTCTLNPASGTNTFNVDGPLNTTSLSLSASGTCNATYNINSLTATTLTPFNTSISCAGAGTGTIVYNINDINLVGANTSNRLLFDGIGTLNVGNNVRLAYFTISNTTVSRTLNFGTNWIQLKTGAIISCAMATTSVTTTTAKTSFSGAGGFRVFEGNTGTLATTGITEANAFNLLFDGAYTATLSANSAWRNIVTSIDSYFGGGAGYFTNTATTFTIYGDLLVRSGENQPTPTNWGLHTFNLAGTDSNVPQFISTNAWDPFETRLPLTTVNCTGASPKIFNQWAHGGGITYIKTLTTDTSTTLIVHKGNSLACDTINVGGGNFDCYGTIYCNRWNPTGNTYYWTGSGYLDVGSGVSFSARGGPTGWTSSTLYNTNSATAGGTGPNFILKGLDVVNEGSTITYLSGPHKVKNLLLSNTTSVGGTAFSVSRGIIYNNGNLTSGGTVTGGNYLYNSSVSSYEGTDFTMTNNTTFSCINTTFCSILWNLPPADGNTYYFEWTMPGQTSPAFQIGVQEPPTRQGAYHSGTSANGNGGLAINTTLTAANTYWFKINTSAKTYAYGTANTGSGTTVSFSSLANPQYFGIYDGTSAYSMTNVTMNFGIASWAYPDQQSGNYYLGSFTQAPPVLNFESGIAPNNRRFITTTSNMAGSSLPLTISSGLNAELDILPSSQNLKVNTLAFNYSSTIRTNSRNIETTAITSDILETDASAITITGSGIVFDNKNIVSGTSAANNYSYYFDSTNAITIAQTSANAINISNAPFTLECWLWPEESYDTPWVWPEPNGSSNTSINPRLSLISKTTSADPRDWSRDWELGLQPYTGIPQFYNGTNFYTGNTGVNEDSWNHIAVTFTGVGQGNQGGGGGQDGASLFDGKPEYRGRSGTTVGSTAIAAPQTLPVTNFWSCYFDGTDDRLNIADSAKSHVGSSAFTLELWAYNTAFDPSGNMLFEKGRFTVGREIRAYMTATQVVFEGNLTATATGAYTTITATTTNALNTWYHLAFIRSGNTLYIFRNGSLLTSAAFTGTVFNTTEAMTIGPADGNNSFMINGYISNVRLITGQALTTTSYTVPTSPLTKTSTGWAGVSLTGTVALLTCNSNQFVDNSDNPAVVSFGGGIPQLASFSPFGSTYNGCVVFNNANYLQAPYSSDLDLSTGENWTVECWFTLPNVTSNTAHSLMGMSNGAGQVNKWLLNVNMSTGFAYQANRVGFVTVIGGVNQWINASYTWESGKWYHIAAVYTSSDTTIRLYVNRICLGTLESNISATTGVLRVGSDGESYRYFNGYIKDARIVKGTAVYTLSATPNQAIFTTPGTYTWTAPAGVTSVSVAAIGGGGGPAGGGGGLGWKNNISVVPGQSYTVVVGAGGSSSAGGNSYFIDTSTVAGFGGNPNAGTGGSYVGDGGGNGGGSGGVIQWNYSGGGGGGAGGYTGAGGTGGGSSPNGTGTYEAAAGAGGGGMGGDAWWIDSGGVQSRAGGGGGTGIILQGTSGTRISGQTWPNGAGIGGSGGTNGANPSSTTGGDGGLYGGGGGSGIGGSGAVRIIWAADGINYSYPTNSNINIGRPSATPLPTQPLTAITNTKILLCQGNGYFDSNTQLTPKTITITGATSTRLEEVSPFYTPNTTASNSFIPTTTLPTTLAYQGPLQGGSPPVNGYGGAGGGGYWGGSAGGYSESNTMAGGGGGSSYAHPTLVTSSAIYNGNYTTPGNNSDADRGTSGNAGAVNTAGQDGKLIITYGATTLTYSTAQFNTAWTCPAGVTTISVKAWGAGGAGGTVGGWAVGFTGGAGACVTGTVSVTPGNIYYLTVGGGGQVNSTTSAIGGGGIASRNNGDNRYGSGGGGYTGIFTSSPATQASALIVAGGGGGGGSSRNTQQLAIYLNGTAIMREATMTNVTHTDTTQFIIGKYISGYIKDVRVVKNAVVYNGTYTVPSAPLGIHSSGSTELLTCQTNSFEDLSTTPKTIVSSGTTVRRLFSPTAIENTSQITFTGSSDATAYITGNLGSIINNIQYTLPSSSNGPVANSYSVLHDSLTQQSTLQANAATQTLSLQNENFTIECWLYPIRWNTMSSSGHVIATTMASSPTYGWAVSFQPTTMDFTVWGTSATTTSATYTFSLNTWYHLVWQRTSSGMEFYINGQLVTNNAPTNRRLYSGGNDSAPLSFGNYIQNLSYRGNGSWRVSNFRIVKNATVYNSGNFTPALPTVTANTVFLGLNTDTFTDQAGTVSYFNRLGTAPTILSNYDYEGTGELTIKTAPFSDSTSPIVSSISQGAGSYSKYFKFNNAVPLASEELNAELFTRFWNNNTVYYMLNFGGLGSGFAHGPMINTNYIYTRTNLPTHTHIRYKCYWHQVDTPDGETNWLEIDGVRYLEFTRHYSSVGATTTAINLLNTFSWSTRSYTYSPSSTVTVDGFFTIDTGQIAHTSSSIRVNHFSGVNSAQNLEAAYLSHVELILYNNGIEVPATNIVLNVNNFSIDGNASYSNWLQGALKQPSNTSNMIFNYLNIRNSQVTGGLYPYWTATNSIDYGLNSGWNFGAPPSSVQDKSFFFFIVT